MPYQYLTFSDLYEEEARSSAPSSPVLGGTASLSPVFLLPTPQHSHASTSYHHHKMPMSCIDSEHLARRGSASTRMSSAHRSRHHFHHHGHHDLDAVKTETHDTDDVAPASSSSSSSSSLHMDFLKLWKRKTSHKKSHSPDSALSTPTSSRRSSFTSSGFGLLHPGSATSSANTSPAISRQITKVSDYDALVQRTARAEEEEERQRQQALKAYLSQAAETGLSLRRF